MNRHAVGSHRHVGGGGSHTQCVLTDRGVVWGGKNNGGGVVGVGLGTLKGECDLSNIKLTRGRRMERSTSDSLESEGMGRRHRSLLQKFFSDP